jgi:mannose-6-phosphate isomerase-like protein (cupin superfamily)
MIRKIVLGLTIVAFAGVALHLKASDSYAIPAGAAHDAKVHGDKPLKVLGIYVVDKTKPLASPAP